MEEKNVRRGDFKKGFLWFGLGFLILVGAIVGSFFTKISAKVTRNLKEIAAPKPQPGPDRETLENGISKMGSAQNGVSVQKLTKYPSRLRILGKWGQMRR
jgi:hypothetical protein